MATSDDLKYICPVCGRQALAGKHFCKPRATAKIIPFRRLKKPGGRSVGPVVYCVAGVLLVFVLLWTWIGSWSIPVVAVGLVAAWVTGRRKDAGASQFAELVRLCGNRETAERLTASEAGRNPDGTRADAVRAALDRLKWDRAR